MFNSDLFNFDVIQDRGPILYWVFRRFVQAYFADCGSVELLGAYLGAEQLSV